MVAFKTYLLLFCAGFNHTWIMRSLPVFIILYIFLVAWQCTDVKQPKSTPATVSSSAQEKKPATDPGKIVFMQYCLSCHQENGEGVDGLYPPLVNSEHVVGDKTWLIKNVLYGQQGPIIVNGKEYNNIMTPLDYLTDKEIAQVLTYVRKVFGELDSPVTEKEVQMVRAQGKDA